MTPAPAIVVIDRSGDPRVVGVLHAVEDAFGRPCETVEDDDLLDVDDAKPGEPIVARDLLEPLAMEAAERTEAWWLAIVPEELKPSAGSDSWAFGEARVGEGCAVVSTRRLRASDDGLFTRRLTGECVHELGHAAGLEHCDDVGCVMRRAADLEEVDRRSSRFCATCAAALRALDNGRLG